MSLAAWARTPASWRTHEIRRSAWHAQMAAACGRSGPGGVRGGRKRMRCSMPAYCIAASQLKTSVHNLGNVNVARNGLSSPLGAVQRSLMPFPLPRRAVGARTRHACGELPSQVRASGRGLSGRAWPAVTFPRLPNAAWRGSPTGTSGHSARSHPGYPAAVVTRPG